MTLETEKHMSVIYLYVDLTAAQAQVLLLKLIYFVRNRVSQVKKMTGMFSLFALERPMHGV